MRSVPAASGSIKPRSWPIFSKRLGHVIHWGVTSLICRVRMLSICTIRRTIICFRRMSVRSV
ncbi:hypothetical protein CP989_25235, partial [Enterobacter hormaechei]